MTFKADFQDSDLPPGITRKMVVNYATLGGSRKWLDSKFGVGAWGLPEVIARLQENQKDKTPAPVRAGKSEDSRYNEYAAAFENITPNDRHSLRTLVALEMRMEDLTAQIASPDKGVRVADLSKTFTELSREHRQLQVSLGIGRAERGEQINTAAELKGFVKAARDLLAESTIPIRCPEHPDFNLGYVLYHFRENTPFSFTFTCPKDGALQTISGPVPFSTAPFELPGPAGAGEDTHSIESDGTHATLSE